MCTRDMVPAPAGAPTATQQLADMWPRVMDGLDLVGRRRAVRVEGPGWLVQMNQDNTAEVMIVVRVPPARVL